MIRSPKGLPITGNSTTMMAAGAVLASTAIVENAAA
jgi:hypothetical protein